MVDWIKAFTRRMPLCFLAVLMVIVSFKVTQWHGATYLAATFIFITSAAIMIHNDWRDRFHDAKKGKDFALTHNSTFRIVLIVLWIISISLAIVLWKIKISWGLLSMAIIASGVIYSETRKIPLLPMFIVAATSAAPALYPMFDRASISLCLLFSATTLIVIGREILKDVDDYDYDLGYKWTLPLAMGTKKSKMIAGLLILIAPAIALGISVKILIILPLIVFSAFWLIADKNQAPAKISCDIAMGITLFVLLVWGR